MREKIRTLRVKPSTARTLGDVAHWRTLRTKTRVLADGTTIRPVHTGRDGSMGGLVQVPYMLEHPIGHKARFPEGAIILVVDGVLQFGDERYEEGWILWIPPNLHYMPLCYKASFECRLAVFYPAPPEVVTLHPQQKLPITRR
ncbi:MAG: hypothetical protein ABIG66_01845 [Candidatus Kerfeldbacteria bacterium]